MSNTIKIVYRGGMESIKMGKYIFFRDKPREVPEEVADAIFNKPQPFELWDEFYEEPEKTETELTKEQILEIQRSC